MSAIACDLDGCVVNFTKGFHARMTQLGQRRGITIPAYPGHRFIRTWHWGRDINAALNEATWQTILGENNRGFWYGLEPLYDLAYLRQVYKRIPLVFITRRDGGDAYGQTIEWLRDHGIKEPLLYCAAREPRFPRGGEAKAAVCAKLGISTIIEDSPAYTPQLLDRGMNVVLITYPYNAHVPKRDRLYRVFSLDRAIKKAMSVNRYCQEEE